MLKKLRQWLRQSRHVHIRERSVNTLSDMVELIDRFIDGRVRYPLEWDDFVSWNNENQAIEVYRDRIATLEPLFFSKDPVDRSKAIADLLEQRMLPLPCAACRLELQLPGQVRQVLPNPALNRTGRHAVGFWRTSARPAG